MTDFTGQSLPGTSGGLTEIVDYVGDMLALNAIPNPALERIYTVLDSDGAGTPASFTWDGAAFVSVAEGAVSELVDGGDGTLTHRARAADPAATIDLRHQLQRNGFKVELVQPGGALEVADLEPLFTGLQHTVIQNVDLKATGNPNEYLIEVTWQDGDGVVQTTTDPTPLLIEGVAGPWFNPDGTPATAASTEILTAATVLEWDYLVATWSAEPVSSAVTSGGEVFDYTLGGTTRYRFVPDPYVPTADAFYETFDGTTLGGLIVARG